MKTLVTLLIILFLCSPALAKQDKKHKNLPPGLQKKYERTGELPPGWQKKLVIGDTLDPKLYKMGKKTKGGGYSKVGTEDIQIEDKIIRVKKNTKEILEVFGVTTEL